VGNTHDRQSSSTPIDRRVGNAHYLKFRVGNAHYLKFRIVDRSTFKKTQLIQQSRLQSIKLNTNITVKANSRQRKDGKFQGFRLSDLLVKVGCLD
jgi:hypothetical protein